jgi:hypothetical protein
MGSLNGEVNQSNGENLGNAYQLFGQLSAELHCPLYQFQPNGLCCH